MKCVMNGCVCVEMVCCKGEGFCAHTLIQYNYCTANAHLQTAIHVDTS